MSKTVKLDPNDCAAKDAGIFGLDFTPEDAELVIIPVPWEATTSYGGGTSGAPKAILTASHQVDLYDLDLGHFYEKGICLLPLDKNILAKNRMAKAHAQKVIKSLGTKKQGSTKASLTKVNNLSQHINVWVADQAESWITRGKKVGLLGGDHSTPLGLISVLSKKYPSMGILHIDAHADLRRAYEGFTYSHASIMYNVLEETRVPKLVQVGIRDFCEAEVQVIKSLPNRVQTYFDGHIQERLSSGETWKSLSDEIVSHLPSEVYISFDIDGLDPQLCPHTGTPVPGGLTFFQGYSLFKSVVQSGRKIVGFDLNEISPGPKGDEWDANVGARMLFKLCGWTLQS